MNDEKPDHWRLAVYLHAAAREAAEALFNLYALDTGTNVGNARLVAALSRFNASAEIVAEEFRKIKETGEA